MFLLNNSTITRYRTSKHNESFYDIFVRTNSWIFNLCFDFAKSKNCWHNLPSRIKRIFLLNNSTITRYRTSKHDESLYDIMWPPDEKPSIPSAGTIGTIEPFKGTSAISGRNRRVTSSTTMLLVVSVVFLITNAPMVVCMLGYDTWLSRANSLRDVARLRLFQGICSVQLLPSGKPVRRLVNVCHYLSTSAIVAHNRCTLLSPLPIFRVYVMVL